MKEEANRNRVKLDLIVIGNPNSGKTSLIRRFIEGETSFTQFYTPTLGLTLEKKIVTIDESEVTVCIWDTAGQEKFFSLTKNYFKKADGVLVVFDLTDKTSFERIQNFWIQEIKDKSDENCSQILVGNKKDMTNERLVSGEVAKQLGDRLAIPYFETSARTGEGVQEAIEWLVRECLGKVKDEQTGGRVQVRPGGQRQSSCFSGLVGMFGQLKEKFRS